MEPTHPDYFERRIAELAREMRERREFIAEMRRAYARMDAELDQLEARIKRLQAQE